MTANGDGKGVHRCPEVWNVLHDAIVVGITGEFHGTLRLELECDYLRDRIDDPGNRFFMTLEECTRFVYHPWDDQLPSIEDLTTIVDRRLWILSADRTDGFCTVHCSEHIPRGNGGKLEVAAAKITVTIDNGREIPPSELEDVAEEPYLLFALLFISCNPR